MIFILASFFVNVLRDDQIMYKVQKLEKKTKKKEGGSSK